MSNKRNERGIALLTVITALMALMVIAVPFAIAMRMGQQRSVATNAKARARHQVESVLRFLESYLVRTTERVEIQNRDNDLDVANNDPEADAIAEIQPTMSAIGSALGVTTSELQDPYGTILGWEVEDENGKLNLNSASFFALGNLMGMSVLSEEVSEGESAITLEDASNFPDRGYVKIGRELIKYTGRDGNRLTGCERGLSGGGDNAEHGPPQLYKAGQWVVNYAAWAISDYLVARHVGEFTPFESLDVSDISRLADLDPEVPVITQADWERVEPFVTVWSKGPVAEGWANVQPIEDGTSLPSQANEADQFNYGSGYYYNPGTVLRLTEKAETNIDRDDSASYQRKELRPVRRDYVMCFESTPGRGLGTSNMELFGKVHRKFDGNQLRVEYLVRHPVNVNTAPREVLVAIFANLKLRGKSERVTAETAGRVADEIIKRRGTPLPLRSMRDFHEMLLELQNRNVLSSTTRETIYRNALNSNDNGLEFGTAPVTFRTFDVYTLRATATVSDAGGRQLAKHDVTRVVEIGSQVTAARIWETQTDFEEQLVLSNDPRYWTSGPINTGEFVGIGIQPLPRWPKHVQQSLFPWDPWRYDKEQAGDDSTYSANTARSSQVATNGNIRLSPARMEFDTAANDAVYVEHFDYDRTVEGRYVTGGYPLSLNGRILDALDGEFVNPFSVQFWWNPQSEQSGVNSVLFDVAESEYQNRYACFVDANRNQLVFSIADNTTTQRASELRYDLTELGGFTKDIWYHIHLIGTGCHPSKMTMIVDGRAVGRPNILTHLSGNLTVEDGQISVEDASGFPSRGAVMIGTEVIEYDSVADNAFTVKTDADGEVIGRGRRGTLASEHVEGSTVVLFGYSRPLIEGLRVGGATLDGELGPYSLLTLNNYAGLTQDTPFATYDPPVKMPPYEMTIGTAGSGGPPLTAALANPLLAQGAPAEDVILRITTWSSDVTTFSGFQVSGYSGGGTLDEQAQAFQPEGYCLVVYVGATSDDWENFVNGGRENVRMVAEFFKYTRSTDGNTADSLTLQRLEDNDGSQTAPEREDELEMLLAWEQQGPENIVRGAVNAYIIPVSIRTTQTNNDNYINPADDEDIDSWFAQIKLDDNSDVQKWEWFRYSELLHTGSSSFFLKADVPNEELLTDSVVGESFLETLLDRMGNTQTSTTPDNPDDNPDGEPPTPDPGPGDPGPGPGDPGPGPGDGPTAPPAGDPSGGGDAPPPPGNTPDPDAPGGGDAPGNTDPQNPGDPDAPGGGDAPGNTDPENPGDPDGPGGGDEPGGGEPRPPDPDQPGGGDLPPGEGGEEPPSDPGDPPTDPGDPDTPPSSPDDPTLDPPELIAITGATSAVADVHRMRGVQSDRNQDGRVNDYWGAQEQEGDDRLLDDGSLIVPVAASYGGPGPDAGGTAGEDYCAWPLPGDNDDVTLVTGDDQTREGDGLTVFWAMTGSDQRLRDKTTLLGTGEVEPFDFGDTFVHLFALNIPTNNRFMPMTEQIDPRTPEYRGMTRLLAFPSGEMIDNTDGLSQPRIGASFSGNTFAGLLDEVQGKAHIPLFRLCLADEALGETDETFAVTSSEGTPNEADIPQGPGVVRIGDELIVFREAGIVGTGLQFSGCVRGVMRTVPRRYEQGAPVEIMFGIYVGLLTEGVSDSTNQIVGIGFDDWPRTQGVGRLEDPESERVELFLYTKNLESYLSMPQSDIGSGIFRGRYGTTAGTFESGLPVFWQPVRRWDRYTEYNDDAELSFFSFKTQLTDAFIKRVWWEEGPTPERTNVRVLIRLNEAIGWNATAENVIWLSRDGDSGDLTGMAGGVGPWADQTANKQGSPLRYLGACEDPLGDNLIRLQADKVELRMFMVYEPGAFVWDDASATGWKGTQIIEQVGIEYLQNNRTHRNQEK